MNSKIRASKILILSTSVFLMAFSINAFGDSHSSQTDAATRGLVRGRDGEYRLPDSRDRVQLRPVMTQDEVNRYNRQNARPVESYSQEYDRLKQQYINKFGNKAWLDTGSGKDLYGLRKVFRAVPVVSILGYATYGADSAQAASEIRSDGSTVEPVRLQRSNVGTDATSDLEPAEEQSVQTARPSSAKRSKVTQ